MQKILIPTAHRRWRLWPFLALTALTIMAGGCASGDQTLDAVDPQAVTATPTYDQVFAIVHNNCATCHEGSGEGEGEGFVVTTAAATVVEDVPGLDDCTSIVALSGDILDQIDANTMPPGAMPRLTSEEKLIIHRWVENGAVAPCNPAN